MRFSVRDPGRRANELDHGSVSSEAMRDVVFRYGDRYSCDGSVANRHLRTSWGILISTAGRIPDELINCDPSMRAFGFGRSGGTTGGLS